MEVRKRNFFAFRLILAFFISTFLFLIIFFGSYLVAYSNLIHAESSGKLIESRLEYFIDTNSQCDLENFSKLSISLQQEGARVSFLEEKLGKENERVLSQKLFYSDLEITHFLLAKTLNEKCNASFIPLLFFYSNEESFREDSERESFILSNFKQEYPLKVMVYSFDVEINSTSITELVKYYNVSSIPSVFESSGKKMNLDNIDDLNYLLINTS